MNSTPLISSFPAIVPPSVPGLTPEQWQTLQQTIHAYFERLNAQDFTGVSHLFTPEGILHAPFESGIVGPEAIAQYLQTEATGMTTHPQSLTAEILTPDQITIKVHGTVQTPWFSVNVAWSFQLDPGGKILTATIQLLASPQELLNLQRSSSAP